MFRLGNWDLLLGCDPFWIAEFADRGFFRGDGGPMGLLDVGLALETSFFTKFVIGLSALYGYNCRKG